MGFSRGRVEEEEGQEENIDRYRQTDADKSRIGAERIVGFSRGRVEEEEEERENIDRYRQTDADKRRIGGKKK